MILALCALLYVACSGSAAEGTSSSDAPKSAENLYNTHCSICHGNDGRKGLAGAKMLPDSELDLNARIALITNGKGTMMPFRGILSKEEIARVAQYTIGLQ